MEHREQLRVLGEPMRLRILDQLTQRQYCVRSLARLLNISEPAVSQHLRVMRQAGLVMPEKRGYHTHYRPVPETLEALGEEFRQLARAAREAPMEEHRCGRHVLAAHAAGTCARHEAPAEDKCHKPHHGGHGEHECPGPEECECHKPPHGHHGEHECPGPEECECHQPPHGYHGEHACPGSEKCECRRGEEAAPETEGGKA